MNVVMLQGTLSSEPRETVLASGSTLMQWEVTTPGAERLSVPVAWFDPPASVRGLAAGDVVVVSGVVRRRFYRAGGSTRSSTEVIATRGARSSRRAAVDRIVDAVISSVDTLARDQVLDAS